MKHTFRSFWNTFWFIFFVLDRARGISLAISVSSFSLSLVGKLSHNQAATLVSFGVGLFFLMVSGYRILKEILKTGKLQISPDPDIRASLDQTLPSHQEERDNYTVVRNPYRHAEPFSFSPTVNRELRSNQKVVSVSIDRRRTSQLRAWLRRNKDVFAQVLRYLWWDSFGRRVFINETKIGLLSSLSSQQTSVTVFKTDYFSTYLTNGLATSKLFRLVSGEKDEYYKGSVYFPSEPVENRIRIKDFREYLAGNNIGVSVLAITSDKYLCLWEQSDRTQYSSGLLVPTGSGSLNWKDLRKVPSRNLIEIVTLGAQRELREECKRRGRTELSKDIVRTEVIGFFRNYSRAGKPEFVLISLLAVDSLALSPNYEVLSYRDGSNRWPVKTVNDLKQRVKEMINTPSILGQLSIPLHASLVCLNQYIDDDQPKLSSFFDYQ